MLNDYDTALLYNHPDYARGSMGSLLNILLLFAFTNNWRISLCSQMMVLKTIFFLFFYTALVGRRSKKWLQVI